jgi:hypothetical protein
VRNHDEIEIAIPRLRQVIGFLLAVVAVLVLVNLLPFGTGTFVVVLLLVAAGMLV